MKAQVFTKENKYLMLALDHRGSFKRMINPENPQEADKDEIIQMKHDIIASVADQFSGTLIDPTYGLPAYKRVDNNQRPFLLSSEKSGYQETEGGRKTEIKYSALQLKNLGANGVKLLLYVNPFNEAFSDQVEVGRKVLNDAQENDMPLFLELVTYEEEGQDKADLIIKSLEMFLSESIKPDVFKLEYPGTAGSCRQISELLGETPWILLTRGAKYDVFKEYLQIASTNGADGFLAGRALWQEVFDFEDKEKQKEFLQDVLPKRFKEISEIVLSVEE